QEILDLHKGLKEEFIHIENHSSGRLSIGIPRMRASFLLPHILPIFYDKFPNVELIIREGSTKTLHELLKKGEIAYAFIPIPASANEFEYEVLYDEELVLVTKKGILSEYVAEKETPIPLSLLSDLDFLLPD